MVIDGGLITIPLLAAVAMAVAGAVGGVGAGCYAATGDFMCHPGEQGQAGIVLTSSFNPCNGTEDRVLASWRPTSSASQDAAVTIRGSRAHTAEWARAVEEITSSGSARFTFDAVLGGAAWFVTRMTGLSLDLGRPPERHSTLNARYELMTQESDSLSVTCPPGVVWQWTLEVSRCGEAPTAVGTRNVRCTPNIEQPPCCMPGYEVSPHDPHAGGCVKTHDGVDTRLRSPPCIKLGPALADGPLADTSTYAPKELAYKAMVERDAQRLSSARAGTLPLGGSALLGAGAALLLLALKARTATRGAPLLM